MFTDLNLNTLCCSSQVTLRVPLVPYNAVPSATWLVHRLINKYLPLPGVFFSGKVDG